MHRAIFLLLVLSVALWVCFYRLVHRKVEPFVSPVDELVTQIGDQESSESEIRTRIQADALAEAEKTTSLQSDSYRITRDVEKADCLALAKFESMSASNLSSARHQEGALLLTKSYHKGEWDDDKGQCTNPGSETADRIDCAQTRVECADSNSNRLAVRVGRQDSNMSDTCVFDACPIYCLSYGVNCWELKSNQGDHFFEGKPDGRSNCVDASHENNGVCVEPVVQNCPDKFYYFYDTDKTTIRSNLQSVTLSSDYRCVYTKPVDQITFDTLVEAQESCTEMATTKSCYAPNGSGQFSHSQHTIDRSVCRYPSEPSVCMEYSELSCPNSPEYYSVRSSSYDSAAGVYRRTFSSSTIPQRLELQSDGGYLCAHTQPSGGITQSQLASECSASCFLGDGTASPVTKSGSVNSQSECLISDCHETSQQRDVSSCPLQSYYYYAGDNTTISASPKTKAVSSFNQCTYSIPDSAPLPNFESRALALDNCGGLPSTKVCQYTDSSGSVASETHPLDRTECSYTGERSGCSSGFAAGTDCPGTTVYSKVNDDVVYFDGTARKMISSTTLSHKLRSSSGGGFTCEAQVAPSGFVANPDCSIDCYTQNGGATMQTIQGSVEGGECMVSSGCFDSAQLTECSESTTYYKLGAGTYDGSGNFEKPVQSTTVAHTLDNNNCVETPPPIGYDAVPSLCSNTCFPSNGAASRQVTGSVTGSNCVITDCYENQKVVPSSMDRPPPDSISGYTLDDGSAYGVASEDLYKMYYHVDLSKQASHAHGGKVSAQECANECEKTCDCMAFTYYTVGGLSTDPSKNCFTTHLPKESSETMIKLSSRPATSAIRHNYVKDSYKNRMGTVERDGVHLMTELPLSSEKCPDANIVAECETKDVYKLGDVVRTNVWHGSSGGWDKASAALVTQSVTGAPSGTSSCEYSIPEGYTEDLPVCSLPECERPSGAYVSRSGLETCEVNQCYYTMGFQD